MMKVFLATAALSLALGFGLPTAQHPVKANLDRAAATPDGAVPKLRAL
jgi:hypothetical protein